LPFAIGGLACNQAVVQPDLSGTGPRVLFIGNSLTYYNDLPGMVAALSRAAGDTAPLVVGSLTAPGFALEDHLADGNASRAIATGGWNVVVLQQGPSSLPESRQILIRDTRIFAEQIRAVGAEPALYSVWPERSRFNDFDRASESYRLAADTVDGLLFPAGEAWRAAWRRDSTLPLYGPDEFHPSSLGTYLAALVIYARLRNRSAVGLPAEVSVGNQSVRVAPARALLLQQAADEALAAWGATSRAGSRPDRSGSGLR
jgi:hypothetical protein